MTTDPLYAEMGAPPSLRDRWQEGDIFRRLETTRCYEIVSVYDDRLYAREIGGSRELLAFRESEVKRIGDPREWIDNRAGERAQPNLVTRFFMLDEWNGQALIGHIFCAASGALVAWMFAVLYFSLR